MIRISVETLGIALEELMAWEDGQRDISIMSDKEIYAEGNRIWEQARLALEGYKHGKMGKSINY